MKGDLVLGRVGKNSWWPARIIDVPQLQRVQVYFFGDRKVGRWPLSQVRPYAELASISPAQQPKSKLFQSAIIEAQHYLSHGPDEDEDETVVEDVQAVDERADHGELDHEARRLAESFDADAGKVPSSGANATARLTGWLQLINKCVHNAPSTVPFGDITRRALYV